MQMCGESIASRRKSRYKIPGTGVNLSLRTMGRQVLRKWREGKAAGPEAKALAGLDKELVLERSWKVLMGVAICCVGRGFRRSRSEGPETTLCGCSNLYKLPLVWPRL